MWEKLKLCEGFDWNEGNSEKNWLNHKVKKIEAEQVFLNSPLIVCSDEKHSMKEVRFLALGRTSQGRMLTIIFTIRNKKFLRIISARDMSKKERTAYGKKIEENS